jgi:hypothetical protein
LYSVDGKDAGRCYLTHAAGKRDVWRWTIYGTSKGGMEDTLEYAQAKFKIEYEKFQAATNQGSLNGEFGFFSNETCRDPTSP